ncbi:MAG TPA: BTAD domain-containing putative transcriptional regulator, partial [Acidimicrobiia bacterium]
MAVRVGVLGPIGVAHDGQLQPVPGLPGRLLAILAAHPQRALEPDVLVEALWGEDPPDKSRNTLQVTVNRLRHTLEPNREGARWKTIVTHGSRYRLDLDEIQLDAVAFRSEVEASISARKRGDVIKAREHLERGLGLWRGPAFEGEADRPLIQPEATVLEELRLSAEEDLIDARLELGEHRALTTVLPPMIDAAPLREHRWAQQMLALYMCGRQAEALRTFRDLRLVLAEELGIEPSLELARLEERILLQDETLTPGSSALELRLPAIATSFVGRQREVSAVIDMLDRARMVTITGIGGIGKTRLALAVAAASSNRHPYGVRFVDLSEVADPKQVIDHVVQLLAPAATPAATPATGRGQLLRLIEILRGGRTLLVIDNAEHVLHQTRETTKAVLQGCPNLRVLVTSRVPVGVQGETVFPMPALTTPAEDEDWADMDKDESVM